MSARRSRAAPAIAVLALVALSATPGCAGLVRYSDDISRSGAGRSRLVTTPATIGGVTGFLVGVPMSVAALPVTWLVNRIEKERAPLRADPLSVYLFPSFLMWRAGAIAIGAPFDLLEFAAWRAWAGPIPPTEREQEEHELELDRDLLPAYPVRPIYPSPDREPAAATGSTSTEEPGLPGR
ncbi:MAG: hypothetical protein IPM29_09090 [Planctomycetes bacterium]|nr:hypothetical protein [Planctomycetota bacterium]